MGLKKGAVVVLALLLAGCSLLKANPDNPDAAKKAAAIAAPLGDAACRAVLHKTPAAAPKLADAVAKAKSVLASPDPTFAALQEAVAAVKDEDVSFYVPLGLTAVQAGLAGAGIDTKTIEAGSPAAVGLGAFFDACGNVVGVKA